MRRLFTPLPGLTVLLLLPDAAFAHVIAGEPGGLAHGFLHPLGGIDHMLAMAAIGVIAWQLGGRALWLLPATFIAVMAAGWGLAMADVAMPHVEIGIAASVIVFGLAILLGAKAPLILYATLAAIFALFHGYAHGAEMSASDAPMRYAAGFVTATALLHAGGIGIGAALGRLGGASGAALRAAGLAVASVGSWILVQAV